MSRQQSSTRTYVESSSEFKKFLAFGILAADKHRDCKGYTFVLPPLNERSASGQLRSWEWGS